MGFFSEIASEARRGMAPSIRQPAPPPAVPEPVPVASAADSEPPATRPGPVPEPIPTPAAPNREPVPAPEPPSPPGQTPPPELKLDAAEDAAQPQDDTARRKAHEAAEAKRKAEWDAKQAKKTAARQAALDKIAAMNGAELLAESVKRVAADTEKLTRRNMKEAVAEHIQVKCREDAAFAMLVMDPMKSMVNCFQYINRQAQAYRQEKYRTNGTRTAF